MGSLLGGGSLEEALSKTIRIAGKFTKPTMLLTYTLFFDPAVVSESVTVLKDCKNSYYRLWQ